MHILSWHTIYRGHIPNNVLDNLSQEKRTNEWRERLENGPVVENIDEKYFSVLQGKPKKVLIDFLNELVAQELNNDSLYP